MAAGEEKWFLEFDYVNTGKPATVYFDINDAIIFKQKVEQSLKEQKGKGFNPKNTLQQVLDDIAPGRLRRQNLILYFILYRETVKLGYTFLFFDVWQAESVLTKHSPHKTAETLLR
jgi:hypothetical protein